MLFSVITLFGCAGFDVQGFWLISDTSKLCKLTITRHVYCIGSIKIHFMEGWLPMMWSNQRQKSNFETRAAYWHWMACISFSPYNKVRIKHTIVSRSKMTFNSICKKPSWEFCAGNYDQFRMRVNASKCE